MRFEQGDTVKSLLRHKLKERGFVHYIAKDKFITVSFHGTKLSNSFAKLFSNYELVRTRIILIERYEI